MNKNFVLCFLFDNYDETFLGIAKDGFPYNDFPELKQALMFPSFEEAKHYYEHCRLISGRLHPIQVKIKEVTLNETGSDGILTPKLF